MQYRTGVNVVIEILQKIRRSCRNTLADNVLIVKIKYRIVKPWSIKIDKVIKTTFAR